MTPAAFTDHRRNVTAVAIEAIPADPRSGDVLVVLQDDDGNQFRWPCARASVPEIGQRFAHFIADAGPELRSVA